MTTIIILSALAGAIFGVGLTALVFVRVVRVTWTDTKKTPLGAYTLRRNVLLEMQDEIVKGGFLKIESKAPKHVGRLLLIKF